VFAKVLGMSEGSLNIDLADPADIRAKRAEIKRLYSEKRKELKAAEESVKSLEEQVDLLARLTGDSPGRRGMTVRVRTRAGQNAPGQDRAVAALERANRPMGPTSLHRFMIAEGMDAPKDANTLGSNLWQAWKAGRIMKAPNGVYTPLDDSGRTEWDRPLTDYDWAASIMPDAPQPAVRVSGFSPLS
jgi:hypothetical protein